jgi:hypothetical protein
MLPHEIIHLPETHPELSGYFADAEPLVFVEPPHPFNRRLVMATRLWTSCAMPLARGTREGPVLSTRSDGRRPLLSGREFSRQEGLLLGVIEEDGLAPQAHAALRDRNTLHDLTV